MGSLNNALRTLANETLNVVIILTSDTLRSEVTPAHQSCLFVLSNVIGQLLYSTRLIASQAKYASSFHLFSELTFVDKYTFKF